MTEKNNNKPKTTMVRKKTTKPRSKDDAHYVDNKEFYKAFVTYHEKYQTAKKEGKPLPKIPDYIGSCFLKIAERYSHHSSFVNYPYRDEMISDAIENCVLYAHDFNPNIGTNPFAYFTQVTWNAFVRRINKENRNKYLTYKSHQLQSIQMGLSGSSFGNENYSGHPSSTDSSSSSSAKGQSNKPQDLYENINSYIDDYERKAKEKRNEKKKRLAELKASKMKK